MTGKEKYLAPLRSMAAARLEWLKHPPKESPPPGSRAWCGSKLGFLGQTLVKYRLLTGSDEFDKLLARDYGDMGVTDNDPDRANLTQTLKRTAEALAINFPGRTSEVRWTDRVFAFSRLFGRDMLFPEAAPACSSRPEVNLLYATATGDRGNFPVFPLNAVRWLTEPREIAALETERGADRFSAELFHFGSQARTMGAELYLLKPGSYRYTLIDDTGTEIAPAGEFLMRGLRVRIEFVVPPRKPCSLKVSPVGR